MSTHIPPGKRIMPSGYCTSGVYIVSDVGGRHEASMGRPLVGDVSQELDTLYLPKAGLRRQHVHVNTVYPHQPPNNRKPNEAEIAYGWPLLLDDIYTHKPRIIVAMGETALAMFEPPASLQACHGRPYQWHEFTIFPTYHPAAGMYDGINMARCIEDFTRLGQYIDGKVPLWRPPTEKCEYLCSGIVNAFSYYLNSSTIIGVDTETADGEPYSVQVSCRKGTGHLIMEHDALGIPALKARLEQPEVLTVFHNAPFDLAVLHKLGIHPARYTDTMTMAYLLQTEPLGLKPLAFRHFGVQMREYKELVVESTRQRLLAYLQTAAAIDWPDPEPEEKWEGKRRRYAQPQNIGAKIRRLLDKAEGVDLAEKWANMAGASQVIDRLGAVREGTIADVPLDTAVYYGCQDADMTLRLYHVLWPCIQAEGLEAVLDRDIRIVPAIVDMESNGMPIQTRLFEELSQQLHAELDVTYAAIQEEMRGCGFCKMQVPVGNKKGEPQFYDEEYNPNSPKVCADYCAFRKYNVKSTEEKYLAPFAAKDEGLQLHLKYKGIAKLLSTYVDKLPRIAVDERIHCRLMTTVTSTGRLSSRGPNLQNIPVKGDGNMVRRCFAVPSYEGDIA